MNSEVRSNLAIVLSLVLMSACGGKQEPIAANTGADKAAASAATGGLPAPDCPARVRRDLAGPDISGLKLGMTPDEALVSARCALGAEAYVKTENRWLDHLDTFGVELGPQTFTVQKGDNKPCDYQRRWQQCGPGNREWGHVDEIVVGATPGAPGHEKAMAIWRTQNFRDGQMPPVQTVVDALVAKYGPPQRNEASDQPNGYTAGYRELEWVQDRHGKPLSDPNPLYRQCWNAIHGHGEQTELRWQDGCGLNVWARISLSGKNPGLAMELDSAMVQQSDLYAQAEATQTELRQLGQAHRDAEVKRAQEASDVHL